VIRETPDPPTLVARKRALRRRIAALRRAWPPGHGEALGRRVLGHLAEIPEWRRARRVGLYASLADELGTRPLFERAREQGKEVLLPRCVDGRRLEFAPVASWSELVPGRYGLLEPPASAAAEPLDAGDLLLLPGVAFDRRGRRLGRGGGYYDRTLAELEPRRERPEEERPGGGPPRGPVCFGLAASLQVIDEVPTGRRDRAVAAVLTEDGLLRADASAGTGGTGEGGPAAGTADPAGAGGAADQGSG